MKVHLTLLAGFLAGPVLAQTISAPAPATPRVTPSAPRGPGSANNPAVVTQPGAVGRTFSTPTTPTARISVNPATGLPTTNAIFPSPGTTVFPPPGTQVVNPGVAVGNRTGANIGGVILTPDGVVQIPAQGAPVVGGSPNSGLGANQSSLGNATAASGLGAATAGSALGAATQGSTLGSSLGTGSTLGNSLGAGSGLGAATTSPGIGTGFGINAGAAPSASGGPAGGVLGTGAGFATGTVPVTGGAIYATPGNPVTGTSGSTFPGNLDSNGVVTPGSISGQGTPTLIVPSTPTGTNGLGAAPAVQVIEVPVPVYIPQPVDEFLPEPIPQHVIPGPVNQQFRNTPRTGATRMIRQLPPPITPPPPRPR